MKGQISRISTEFLRKSMFFGAENFPYKPAVYHEAVGWGPDFPKGGNLVHVGDDTFVLCLSRVKEIFEIEKKAEMLEFPHAHQADHPEIPGPGIITEHLLTRIIALKTNAPFSMLLKHEHGPCIVPGREGLLPVDIIIVQQGIDQGILKK